MAELIVHRVGRAVRGALVPPYREEVEIVPNEKLKERARDELFSHINRCGVLQASPEDQVQWMNETIEYIGERYPDLTDGDLRDLHGIGIRFCKPAIARTETRATKEEDANAA